MTTQNSLLYMVLVRKNRGNFTAEIRRIHDNSLVGTTMNYQSRDRIEQEAQKIIISYAYQKIVG